MNASESCISSSLRSTWLSLPKVQIVSNLIFLTTNLDNLTIMSISRTIHQSRNSLFSTIPRSYIRPASVQIRNMSNTNIPIENTNISTATGVDLSAQQKTIVGSVLDLFAGRPSLEKLQLWTDDAVFEDPITVARGRKQYEPQWVCLLRFDLENSEH